MRNNLEQTQSVLYLGYVLLVILGIINETLFYSQFGVNILEYSDILDVLLSPVSKLTSNKVLLILSVLIILLVIVIPKKANTLKNKKWFASFFRIKPSEEDAERRVLNGLTVFALIFFIGVFVGAGLGKGSKLKTRMESGEVEYNDQINFIDGQSLNVEVIGKNSSYIFYLNEDHGEIKISPINGTVKSLSINE